MEDPTYLYAVEKYAVAVSALVGAEDIRDRLYHAFKSILPLYARDMPEHLREEHEALKEALTWVPVEEPGEGTLRATLRAMDEREAGRLAKKFFELYMAVNDASYRARQGPLEPGGWPRTSAATLWRGKMHRRERATREGDDGETR